MVHTDPNRPKPAKLTSSTQFGLVQDRFGPVQFFFNFETEELVFWTKPCQLATGLVRYGPNRLVRHGSGNPGLKHMKDLLLNANWIIALSKKRYFGDIN